MLNATVWPLLAKKPAEVEAVLDDLERVGLIELWRTPEGVPFAAVTNWETKAGTLGQKDHRRKSAFDVSASTRVGRNASGLAFTLPTSGGSPTSVATLRVPASDPDQASDARARPRGAEPDRAIASQVAPREASARHDEPQLFEAEKAVSKPSKKIAEHVQVVEMWIRCWAFYRHGVAREVAKAWSYGDTNTIPVTAMWVLKAKDWVAAANLWRESAKNLDEIKSRMQWMLESDVEWIANSASLSLLDSKWNQFDPKAQPGD